MTTQLHEMDEQVNPAQKPALLATPFRSGIVGYPHDYKLVVMTVHVRLVCAQT